MVKDPNLKIGMPLQADKGKCCLPTFDTVQITSKYSNHVFDIVCFILISTLIWQLAKR